MLKDPGCHNLGGSEVMDQAELADCGDICLARLQIVITKGFEKRKDSLAKTQADNFLGRKNGSLPPTVNLDDAALDVLLETTDDIHLPFAHSMEAGDLIHVSIKKSPHIGYPETDETVENASLILLAERGIHVITESDVHGGDHSNSADVGQRKGRGNTCHACKELKVQQKK